MKIVIAPDSFKENLTSFEVASELEAGLKRVWPDATYIKVPMADGGEGTVQSLVDATGGTIVQKEVTAPLGNQVLASYGLLGNGRRHAKDLTWHLTVLDHKDRQRRKFFQMSLASRSSRTGSRTRTRCAP